MVMRVLGHARVQKLGRIDVSGIDSEVEDYLDSFELAAEFTDKYKWLVLIPILLVFDVQVTANLMLLQSVCAYIQQGGFTMMYFL